MRLNRDCPGCGSNKHKPVFSQRFTKIDGGSLLTGYEVVACQRCGFCFADGIPEQSAFDQYYQELSKYEHQGLPADLSDYDVARYAETAELLHRFIENADARILDIGCATGGLLYSFKKYGYANLQGLDPSALCSRIAKQLYQIEVFTGSLFDLSAIAASFDLMILGSVIEHIRNLKEALTLMRDSLNSGGLLYVDCPDAARFSETEEAPFQEFSTEHINYFSPNSLTKLIEQSGFEKIYLIQTCIQPNPGKTIREIKGVFRKSDTKSISLPEYSDETEKALTAYVAHSRSLEKGLHQIINKIVDEGFPILIWGVGAHTQRLLATSQLSKANIRLFIDSNPRYQGKTLMGKPIISPQDLRIHRDPILIATRGYQQEIDGVIRNVLKLSNKIIYLHQIKTGAS